MSEIRFRLLRADEADALVRFIESVYGPTYPSDLFCDASSIRRAIEDERLFSSVALDEAGRIVGHLATLLECPEDVTGDGITGMVAPEARGQNVVARLAGPLFAVHGERGIAGLHLYPVTLHDITQRHIVENGGVVTGILLGDWPADLSLEGFAFEGLGERLPMLMMHFPFAPLPERTVYLPEIYAEPLEHIHSNLRIERETRIVSHEDGVIPTETSTTSETRKPRQGCASLRLHRVGSDWSRIVEAWRARSGDVPIHYIEVNLCEPTAGRVIGDLRERGWFFGGLLLERGGTDFLRMQRCDPPPQPGVLKLCEPGLQMIEFVLEDRERVQYSSKRD